MPISSRLARLERFLAERPASSSYDQAAEERCMRLVVSDPETHGHAARLAEHLALPGRAAEAAAAASAHAERLNRLAA